jgi:hypothetical protein
MLIQCDIEARDSKGRIVPIYDNKAHELRLVILAMQDHMYNDDGDNYWETMLEGDWVKKKDINSTQGLRIYYFNHSWVYFKENGGRLYMDSRIIRV